MLTMVTSTASNYQVAAIAAVSNNSNSAKKMTGVTWINRVTVANNYLYNASADLNRSGVLVGSFSDTVYVDNCLVYDNDATFGTGSKMPLINNAGNSTPGTVAVPEGLVTSVDLNAGNLHYNMVRNSIILGCDPYDVTQPHGNRFNDAKSYKNVYTDSEVTLVVFADDTREGYTPELKFTPAQLTHITADEIKGINARAVMPQLDWNNAITNPDGAWYCSNTDGMPSLAPVYDSIIDISSEFTDIYDTIVFDTPDTIGYFENHQNGTMAYGVYQTALSLKSTPYMSFAFAFLGDYRTNRDKIKITFTYTVDGTEHTTDPISPPKYDGTDIKDVYGWTNTARNGRYHTYKAKDLPISAMESGITVKASYNDGNWENLGTFSVDGVGIALENANKTDPCDYYQTRIDAAKALLFYIKAIKIRYDA